MNFLIEKITNTFISDWKSFIGLFAENGKYELVTYRFDKSNIGREL